MSEESRLVQDHVSVGESIAGSSNVPVKLHTLLVRRPGRVQAAMDFVDKCLSVRGFGALGAGDDETKEEEFQAGAPSAEFLLARKSAMRTIQAYFEGLIDDELMVQAEFKIDGKMYDARFTGKIDAETGRVRDARINPRAVDVTPVAVPPVAAEPTEQYVLRMKGGLSVTLPAGVTPDDVKDILGREDPDGTAAQNQKSVMIVLKSGISMIVDPKTGRILGTPQ